MRLAAYQMDVEIGQVKRNITAVTDRIASAATMGVGLAVFPECVLSGYCFESRDEAVASSLELSSPEVGHLIDAARRHGVYAAVGLLERDGSKLFNAQVLVGPEGLVGSYRKLHLPCLGVDRFVDPGDRPPCVFQAGEAKVGLAICYDISFPEMSRILALQGAEVIALSTNWPQAAQRVAEIAPPCRSFENQVFFVAANRIGTERGASFCGRSSIHGPPDGTPYARAENALDTVIVADVDLTKARTKRVERTPGKHVIDLFADRRTDFYAPLTQSSKS